MKRSKTTPSEWQAALAEMRTDEIRAVVESYRARPRHERTIGFAGEMLLTILQCELVNRRGTKPKTAKCKPSR